MCHICEEQIIIENVMEKIIYISRIISASISRELTPEEEKNLQKWLDEDPKHLEIYNKLRKEESLKEKVDFYSDVNVVDAYSSLSKKLEKRRRHRLLFSVMKYASIFVLPLAVIAVLYNYFPKKTEMVSEQVSVIKAGAQKAHLILADGNRLDISETVVDTTIKEKGADIFSSNNKIKYQASKTRTNIIEYNTLVVPRGGEYILELADGTTIWMNSESKLKYPVKFIGDKRKVYLEGEAYFKVAHNKEKPFVIDVNGSEVNVLGTSFNLRSYKNESNILATLVEGKISLSTTIDKKYTSLILNPGEQGKVNSNGEISKGKVDVRFFTSWKDGRIVFKNQTLGDIMNSIYRWYDIEIFYQNPALKDILYTGNIKRYGDFNDVIKLLELAGVVKFEIKGRTVTVKEK